MTDWKMANLADFINDVNTSRPLTAKQQSEIVSWMTAMVESGIETESIKSVITAWIKGKIVWGHIGEVRDGD